MDDATLVSDIECIDNLARDRHRLRRWHWPPHDAIGERRPLDQLHHQRVVLDAVDGGDIRMIEGGEDLRLAREARQPGRIRGQGGRDQLDRNVASELGVGGAIHLAHGTLAEFGAEAVVGDRVRHGGEW